MNRQRRRFTQLAASMMAAPFLSRINSKAQAQAGSGKPPMRFFALKETYGIPRDNRERLWIDSVDGDFALTPDSLGTILQPLSRHIDKLVVVSDIDGKSNHATRGFINHGGTHALTGSRPSENTPKGTLIHPSLEVAIGRYLNDEYGLASPRVFPHLFFCDAERNVDDATSSFDMDGKGIRGIIGHENIYKTLFGAERESESGKSALLSLDQASQAMAFQLVEERLRELRPQLEQSNAKQIMDAYQTSVSEVATEFQARIDLACQPPPPVAFVGDGNGEGVPHVLDAVYHAFACDMASSIFYSMGGESQSFNSHGFLFDPEKHPSALKDQIALSAHRPSHTNDTISQLCQEVVRTWESELVANLVDRLSVTPDSDGSMMMDNTVIYLASALSYNTHELDGRGGMPLAILAGKNTNLHTGQHVSVAGATTNDLLTTLGQGCGVPMLEFGGVTQNHEKVEELNQGPIEKMLKEVVS